MRYFIYLTIALFLPDMCLCQAGYGNNWILGHATWQGTPGTQIDFNGDTVKVSPVQKEMKLEGANAVMSDTEGNLLFYSNGCYIANRHHETMLNGDSIGMGILATSFCESGGNPLTQGIIALPAPLDNSRYYLFYTDIQSPYEFPSGLYFPLSPLNLFYSVIDMNEDGGDGAVVLKNQAIVNDTLARGMIQATRHGNGHDWWILMPKSHSNCYYTLRLTNNGIDTTFLQCLGEIWGDDDPTGQAVFSPNLKKYVRFNYFYGLSIFDFNNNNGQLSNHMNISFGSDAFNYSGAAFSPNSKFLYATAWDKVYQFDMLAPEIGDSKTLIAELNTPPNIQTTTRFNQSRLAPDGKIYIGGTASFSHLHVINKPNCQGLDCNLEQYSLEILPYNVYGLPNMPNFIEWEESDTCAISTNITVHKDDIGLKIYPNPFQDVLNIESKFPFRIIIYDSLGKIALSDEFYSKSSSIEFRGHPSGIYYYKILTKHMIMKEGKLIKIK
ncbi:MAG: T9SS type A sorting domain-containing protein [Bacteroidetes bacterium]|nr:T9SS type A sorting domain-containing protein [Bacteroidota bacterium]